MSIRSDITYISFIIISCLIYCIYFDIILEQRYNTCIVDLFKWLLDNIVFLILMGFN